MTKPLEALFEDVIWLENADLKSVPPSASEVSDHSDNARNDTLRAGGVEAHGDGDKRAGVQVMTVWQQRAKDLDGFPTQRGGQLSTAGETPQVPSVSPHSRETNLSEGESNDNGCLQAEDKISDTDRTPDINANGDKPTLRSEQLTAYFRGRITSVPQVSIEEPKLIPEDLLKGLNIYDIKNFLDALKGVFEIHKAWKVFQGKKDSAEVLKWLESTHLERYKRDLESNPDMSDFYSHYLKKPDKEMYGSSTIRTYQDSVYHPLNNSEQKLLACALLIPAFEQACRLIEELQKYIDSKAPDNLEITRTGGVDSANLGAYRNYVRRNPQ